MTIDRDRIWDSLRALWEVAFPWVLGFLAVLAYAAMRLWWSEYLDSDGLVDSATFKPLLSSVVDVSAIALGFLLTAKSILLSLTATRVMLRINQEDRGDDLVHYFMSAMYGTFLLTALSLLLIAFDTDLLPWSRNTLVGLWIFLVVFSGAGTLRAVRLLGAILSAAASNQKTQG